MALIKTTIVSEVSGRVGGLVFSHNAGGPYIRQGSIPTNPNTTFQQSVRTNVATLSVMWNDTLTQAERDAWEVYAANVKLTNRIGEQVNVSGIAMFVRSNVARMQIQVDPVIAAPTIFNLGILSKAAVENATEAGQTVDIAWGGFIPLDPWQSLAGSWLIVYVSRPQNPGIKFFKGPYRVAGSLQGDPVPPVSPLTVTVPFAITAGQRLFTRTVVSLVDGRFTTPIFANGLVGA